MAKDIRIRTSFIRHPKTKRLRHLCGAQGVVSLITLWCWTSEFRPKGKLDGLTPREIEDAAGWEGVPGELFSALKEIGFLEGNDPVDNPVDNPVEKICIHDWRDNNPYVYFTMERSESAKLAAQARWKKKRKSNV